MATKPSATPLTPPPGSSPATPFQHVLGVTGQRGVSAWWTVDSSPEMFVGKTSGDLYAEAASLMQMTSDIYWHCVDGKVTQFFGEVDRKVVNDETVHIAGNNTIHCNANHLVEIVGNHDLATAASQSTVVGSGQEITVKSGGRELIVTGNLTENIVGDHKEKITGDNMETVNGKRVHTSNNSWESKIFGPFCAVKASTENVFVASAKFATGYAVEASVTVGMSEKVNIGGSIERASGKKDTKNIGGFFSREYGHRGETKQVSKVKAIMSTIKAKKEIIKSKLSKTKFSLRKADAKKIEEK